MISYLDIFKNSLKFLIPEFYLGISLLLLLIIGIFYKISQRPDSNINYISWLSIEILFITFLLLLNYPYFYTIILHGMIIINDFTLIIKIIITISLVFIFFMGFEYYKYEKFYNYEYAILLLLALLGMYFLTTSYDFMMIYVAIELQSLSFYILAALKRDSQFSTEAGLKYFILGALSSGILLFGFSLIYGLTGSTNFEVLNHLLRGNFNDFYAAISIGIIFIIVALFFKLAVAPFHMWAPDVYEGSPLIVTSLFAIVPKIAVLSLLMQLLFDIFYTFLFQWQYLIVFSAITSMILGALGAIEQKKIKRFLAYSAIGHMGYILIGLSSGTLEGIQSIFIYIILYIIMSVCIFSIILSLYKTENNNRIIYITELTGLAKENPLLAISFSLILLSMAGIPPLAGFFSKLQIFYAALSSSMIFLAVVGVLTSVLGAIYYIRFIKIMYFENSSSFIFNIMDLQKALIISFTFLIILLFIINPSFLLLIAHDFSLNFYF